MFTRWMFGLWCLITVVDAQGNDGLLTDKFLLVADEGGDKIVQVDTETMMTHRQPITVTSQPQMLAYDWLRRDIYWTSGRDRRTIFKYSLESSETLELHTDMTSTAAVYSGLAIDVQRHLLYFTDEGQGQVGELKLKVNYTADMTGRVVDSTAGSRPRSIAVDTVNRLLYWCDFRNDDYAGLYVMSLNDATKSRLMPNAHIRPKALAVDFADQVMYFDDYGSHTFNVLNLSSGHAKPQTLMRVGSITPYAIAVDADFIYLSTQHPRVIKKINRTTAVAIEETLTGTFAAYGLAVFIASEANRTATLLANDKTGVTDLYATTRIIMIMWLCGAVTCIVVQIVVVSVFTLRSRRRGRIMSVGIESVKSWDASVHTGSQLRRPKTAPPPPPIRPDNYNHYDDARAVAETTMDTVVEPEEDYLKPDYSARDVLYSEAADPEGIDGNMGYIELIDSYHEYDN